MDSRFNVMDADFIRDPYPTYRRLQEEAPVYWHEPTGYWWLTRHDDVWNALRDPMFRSGRVDALLGNVPDAQQEPKRILRELLEPRLLLTDGPRHARLRSLIGQAFAPREIERMRPVVRATIQEQLETLRNRSRIEVMSELADPLPSRMICRIIGLPSERFDEFKAWTNDIYAFLGLASGSRGDQAAVAARSGQAVAEFLEKEIAVRRRRPSDDLLSTLIQAEEVGGRLTHPEIIANVVGLLNAGHETTTNLLGNGLFLLLQHPHIMHELRSDPDRIGAVIEEMARLESPVQILGRRLDERLLLHDVELPVGSNVLLLTGAANRDPWAFDDPDRFDIFRAGSRSVSFGYGPHFCIGAALARVIAEEFFRSLLAEWTSLSLIGPIHWRPYPIFRGLSSMTVEVERRQTPGMAILAEPIEELRLRVLQELTDTTELN